MKVVCIVLFVWAAAFVEQLVCQFFPYEDKLLPVRSGEYLVKRSLMETYDRTSRPVRNDTSPVNVNVAISLYQILDTNEKDQTLSLVLAIRQRWYDEYLRWDPDKFDGTDVIRFPSDVIWTPDIIISNFAGDNFNRHLVTNVIVYSTGLVLWLYPELVKVYCPLDIKHFPFDIQHCDIVFISWTHNGLRLDVSYNETFFANEIYYEADRQEWVVDKISATRNVNFYTCCPEPYPDVTFTIRMRRGSLFYMVHLVGPCFLMFAISLLGFYLPIDSGEKVSFETTILLALVVFLLMVGETMPPTPDSIPIVGVYFAFTMAAITVALIMAVVVTNIYSKSTARSPLPSWLHWLRDCRLGKRRNLGQSASASRPNPSNSSSALCQLQHPASDLSTLSGRRPNGGSPRSNCHHLVSPHNDNRSHSNARRKSSYTSSFLPVRFEEGSFPDSVGVGLGTQELGLSPSEDGFAYRSRPRLKDGHRERLRVADINDVAEALALDWERIATLTDRCFFWVFLVVTTGVHVALTMVLVRQETVESTDQLSD